MVHLPFVAAAGRSGRCPSATGEGGGAPPAASRPGRWGHPPDRRNARRRSRGVASVHTRRSLRAPPARVPSHSRNANAPPGGLARAGRRTAPWTGRAAGASGASGPVPPARSIELPARRPVPRARPGGVGARAPASDARVTHQDRWHVGLLRRAVWLATKMGAASGRAVRLPAVGREGRAVHRDATPGGTHCKRHPLACQGVRADGGVPPAADGSLPSSKRVGLPRAATGARPWSARSPGAPPSAGPRNCAIRRPSLAFAP
jgi:hypothetical protein